MRNFTRSLKDLKQVPNNSNDITIYQKLLSTVEYYKSATGKLNDVTIYRGLMSVIEYYNTLNKNERLPEEYLPIYGKHMNMAMITWLMSRIIKDINRIKNPQPPPPHG